MSFTTEAITAENILCCFRYNITTFLTMSAAAAGQDSELGGYNIGGSRLMYEFCAVLFEDDEPIGNVSKKNLRAYRHFSIEMPRVAG